MAVFVILGWLAFASWSIQIGLRKHRLFAGIALGVAFAWAGVIVMSLLPARETE